jgi:hypothetical protein
LGAVRWWRQALLDQVGRSLVHLLAHGLEGSRRHPPSRGVLDQPLVVDLREGIGDRAQLDAARPQFR